MPSGHHRVAAPVGLVKRSIDDSPRGLAYLGGRDIQILYVHVKPLRHPSCKAIAE